jgi:hypothetical protein
MTGLALMALAVSAGSPMARGGPLDPGAFTPLGTLTISGGSYTFNTTTEQLRDSSNNVLFTGVTSDGIAVFDFSQITISGGTFTATGSVGSTGMVGQPLALLSQGDISFTGGSMNFSASISFSPPSFAGPGGFGGGGLDGPGGGFGGGFGGPGGGFGGPGGAIAGGVNGGRPYPPDHEPGEGTGRVARAGPDGKRLASASFDKTVKVWDLTHLGKKPEE